ncbi:MAG: mandelate racemase/muconate lactonizing enzyme family protein, partial [Streptosporangiales bacterium]
MLDGADPFQWGRLMSDLAPQLVGCRFTAAAVETALLDLVGRALDLPVSAVLGGRYRDSIEVHGSVGWDEDPDTMVAAATAHAQRFHALKLYAGRGELDADLDRLDTVRAAVGESHPFLVDVNGQWTPMDAMRAAPRLQAAGVVLVEQPVAPGDEAGMAEVTRRLGEYGIDVAADESVLCAAEVFPLVQHRAARVVNVGLSKLGGPATARDVATVASSAGATVMLGSVVELNVAAAAGLQLAAALPALAYPSYLMGPLKYTRQIAQPELALVDGRLDVPSGPGLGIDVDVDAVAGMDLRRR